MMSRAHDQAQGVGVEHGYGFIERGHDGQEAPQVAPPSALQ